MAQRIKLPREYDAAVRAYSDALVESFGRAELVDVDEVAGGGELIYEARFRIPRRLYEDRREVRRREDRAHAIVSEREPAAAGLLALQYEPAEVAA